MTRAAFALSEELGLPVLLRTTTRLNHTRSAVTLGDLVSRPGLGHFLKDPFSQVMVPAVAREAHARLLAKQEKVRARSEASPFNVIKGTGPWGIVTSGVAAAYVEDAIQELGLGERVTLLKLGFTHPLPEKLIADFLRRMERVLVVEELEPFLEEGLQAIAQTQGLTLPIQGKGDGLFSRLYEYQPALVRQVMARYFGVAWEAPEPPISTEMWGGPLPERPPNLCPGCPHRAMYYVVKIGLKDLGLEGIFPTDIGCYTLGLLPPLSMEDYLICMGSSISTAAGISRATNQTVVAFIGDSTFFHSGITGLISAVHNDHNFILVILDNGTTAMTGHQPHPGVDMKALKFEGYARGSIDDIVKAVGVKHVSIIRPYRVKKSIDTIKDALMYKGVSVIISREPCTLFAKALKKPQGKPFFVSEKCKGHRDCINDLACPAFFIKKDRVNIDPVLCSGCSVCAQICPERAILPLRDKAG